MEPETAQTIVIAITAIGAVAWIAGLAVLLRASRTRQESARPAAERFEVEEQPASGTILGETVVDGEPEELSTKLAAQLAQDNTSAFGPVKILTRDRHQITFEPVGKTSLGFRAGRFRLVPLGSRTRIEYAIDASTGRFLVAGWVSLGLGLVALIAVPTLEFLYILPSPNPIVRIQAIQTIQMVHFLWPPFLFAYRSRQPYRMLQAKMEALVHNLPYT